MRAIVVSAHGGAEVLENASVVTPTPETGELLVEIEFAGVNYRDVHDREGLTPAPFIAGVEGAGPVVAIGPAVIGFNVGDRVAWPMVRGSYAEMVAVKAERAVSVPNRISSETAAATVLQGVTAHYLCSSAYAVQPGDSVLIHAAAGGVGLLLTQMVRLRGGHVIGTVSTSEKAEAARAAGADHVLGYTGCAAAARELTGGAGVAAVFDGVGRATFDESLAALRPRGMLLSYGRSSGSVPRFDLNRLAPGSLMIAKTSTAQYVTPGEWLQGRAAEIFEWIEDGKLRVHVDAVYDLDFAADAHRALESRRTIGKLLLRTH